MTKYYSKTTNGFYDSEINEIRPSDCVEITDAQWISLLENQANKQIITFDANGNPINASIPSPTTEELAAQEAQATAKQSALAKLAALGLTEDEVKALIG